MLSFTRAMWVLIDNIILPPLGSTRFATNLRSLEWVIAEERPGEHQAIIIRYGLWLNAVLEFVFVCLVAFAFVKVAQAMHSWDAQ